MHLNLAGLIVSGLAQRLSVPQSCITSIAFATAALLQAQGLVLHGRLHILACIKLNSEHPCLTLVCHR